MSQQQSDQKFCFSIADINLPITNFSLLPDNVSPLRWQSGSPPHLLLEVTSKSKWVGDPDCSDGSCVIAHSCLTPQ